MCFGAWDARALRRAGSTGAFGTRLSLRPPTTQRDTIFAKLGRYESRECGIMPPRHCEERLFRRSPEGEGGSDEAIHSSGKRIGGLLRFARNDDRCLATARRAISAASA